MTILIDTEKALDNIQHVGFPVGSGGKESTCNAGDLS